MAIPPPQRIRVCHVLAAKPFTAVVLAAYRAYAGTLKKLEIPGWQLTDGHQCVAITDLQQALARRDTTARVAARQRLGMEA